MEGGKYCCYGWLKKHKHLIKAVKYPRKNPDIKYSLSVLSKDCQTFAVGSITVTLQETEKICILLLQEYDLMT